MNKRLRLIIVLLFFALMFTYAGLNAYQTLRLNRSYTGWEAVSSGERVLIKRVFPNGPAASVLRDGDELIYFNGRPIRDASSAIITSLSPGTAYTLGVMREGQEHEFNLRTVPVPFSVWLTLFALTALLPAIGLSTALTVFLLKPFDKQALLVALLFGVLVPPLAFHWFDGLPTLLVLVMYIGPMITPIGFFIILHLFLVFPEPSPILQRWPRLEWYLYLPYPLLFFMRNLSSGTSWGLSQSPVLDTLSVTLINLYFAGAFISLIVNYRRASQASRRKMRVVVAGMTVGVVPAMLVFFTLPVFNLARLNPALGTALPVIGALCFPLMPLAFAYAIMRHRVIPVSLMVRRSVQYLLAKNALRALLALPLIGLLFSILANPERSLADLLLRNSFYFYLLLITTLAIGLFFRKRVTDWIDRKFFREAYSQEKILRELIDDVKKLDSIPEMSKRVTEQVNRSLHPEQVYLFYRAEDARALSLSYSSGGAGEEIKIPEDFQLLRFMELQGGAQGFPFPQKNNLPPSEKEWLSQLGTRLIVPMSGTDNRLAGLFLLGEKKSEVPYTANDRELLETLADQIAIVYENVHLKERVERERRIKREVLARFDEQKINLLKECPQCGACFDSAAETCPEDGRELTLTLPVERVIEGRYRLERLIGRGGMGAVYEATDARLNRRVAVKILTGSMFGNSEALRRFEREAQASARLNHPNIVIVFDYGVLQTEGAYLVMEILKGETLGAKLKRQGCVSCSLAAEWFDQVLEAMKAAHQAGVIHRDLKPENVFITHDEQGGQRNLKVLDFGLAKLSTISMTGPDGPTAPMTTPGTVMGTFGYMSPEQLTGGEVDERSDLFSVGVMVVEALTGRRPFSGKTYTELLTNILHGSFHLQAASDDERRLDEVLQKCLAKDRNSRFNSALAMQASLVPALRNCPAITHRDKLAADADTFIIKS